ncbi:hypothetical protein E2C01_015045 [Portunus trituberculatus]|uniref:Uncharacterized protein n=1 Tax=Portunus trituberculatus TaxID=210409 RepID=A0A5B7DLS4_PORTR|nr:hypothetical protein [Portunus trituberculatus]
MMRRRMCPRLLARGHACRTRCLYAISGWPRPFLIVGMHFVGDQAVHVYPWHYRRRLQIHRRQRTAFLPIAHRWLRPVIWKEQENDPELPYVMLMVSISLAQDNC